MSGTEHELSVTCHIAASRAICWTVWTDMKDAWFCPRPWRAEVIEQDLRPGGRSAVQMFGPDGEETGPMEGVFLEVVPHALVVTTDAYAAGWVPQTPFMTAIWRFEEEGAGTRFTATARHWDAETRARHEEMGFHPGWDQMMAQFKALCETCAARA
ncbi:SRPBCC domain-containing protein [Sphingobium sp. HBC34]|uniref:SRPBCC domain-containing protein n=1 Tax=Sphingobium cyanobacteriorum TaxID=3063954 RepID=A0ABT8ZHK9_9SPHN|nr:SRPBCC domain-containing protein [Sphingobium sp. HBC34]MDO7834019.1 SRPBCC domain-containing protein [Sphingobium sp. HBC34]